MYVQHGLSHHPLYPTYRSMLSRCYDSRTNGFKNYGGRGIKVCERWRNSIHNFLKDMGPKQSPRLQLDRIDYDGDYCPDNCRWATPEEQKRNTRKSKKVYARSPQGRWYAFTCQLDFAMQHNLSPSKVTAVILKRDGRTQHKGWVFWG